MTHEIARTLPSASTFTPMPCDTAPQGMQPQPSASPAASATVVYDDQKEKGQPRIYTREWDEGQAFQVDILNTCPRSFEYEIKRIKAELTGEPVLVGNGPGCPRLRASGRAPHLLLRLAYHAGGPGRVLADLQDVREGGDLARPASSRRGDRRFGGSVPAGVCQRREAGDDA